MLDEFENDRQMLMSRLRAQMRRPSLEAILGSYISHRLRTLNIQQQLFSEKLGLDEEGLEALLKGELPDSLISDALLDEIAQALNDDSDLLHSMLGRASSASAKGNASARIRRK